MTKPRICLNMIVKNESRIIERCLKSVSHLIDTWCIVDTGSTDGTQEIIKKFLADKPGELIERPWVNFGHNRNEAIKYAEKWGDWILLTDADMILEDIHIFTNCSGFDKSTLNSALCGYDVVQDNHGTRYNNTRLLNAKRDWRCIGATHEYYAPADGMQKRDTLHNLFFHDVSDGGSKGDKFQRDIKLLTQGLIDEPKNHRYMFYLAQSYRDTQQYDHAIEWYQNCAKTSTWDEEAWFSEYMVGWCMIRNQKKYHIDEFSAQLMKAWLQRPSRIEPLFELGMIYNQSKKWAQAYAILKICAMAEYPNDTLFINAALYLGKSMDEFGIAAYWSKNYNESIIACNKLIEDKTYGEIHLSRIQKNLWFAEKAMGRYNEEELTKFIQEKTDTVKEPKQLQLFDK